MKKIVAMTLALTMLLAILASCGGAPVSEPEPDPEPVSEPEAAPVSAPSVVEGVVKEVSQGKLTVTLADGTVLAFDTTGVAGLEAESGDTVKVEYTGEIGSLAAGKVEVTAKAEKEVVTVSGVVTGVDDEFVYLTLEDGTDAALRTVSMEEGEVEEGDTLTIHYTDGGGTILSIDVTKAEKEPEKETSAAVATAPAAGSQSGSSNAGSTAGSTSNNAASSSGSGASQSSQAALPKADTTRTATVLRIDPDIITVGMEGYEMPLVRSYFDSVSNGYEPQVGDVITMGVTGSMYQEELVYVIRTGFDPSVLTGDTSSRFDAGGYKGDVYEAIELINAERKKAGLPELKTNSELMEMAAVRAEEMYTKFAHVRPDGRDYWSIFEDFGSSLKPGAENGGTRDTADKVVDAWMSSTKGHKENILDEKATQIGVGFYKNTWTMLTSY